jgi:hypothetical protein
MRAIGENYPNREFWPRWVVLGGAVAETGLRTHLGLQFHEGAARATRAATAFPGRGCIYPN